MGDMERLAKLGELGKPGSTAAAALAKAFDWLRNLRCGVGLRLRCLTAATALGDKLVLAAGTPAPAPVPVAAPVAAPMLDTFTRRAACGELARKREESRIFNKDESKIKE